MTSKATIKCGRFTYEIKKGDKLLDNGACLQFLPKDNSILPFRDWFTARSAKVSKKEFKRVTKEYNFRIYRDSSWDKLIYYVYQGK